MNVRDSWLPLALGGALVLVTAPSAAAPDCEPVEAVTDFGSRYPGDLVLNTEQPRVDPAAGAELAAAAWFKARFDVETDDAKPWRLTLRDPDNHVLANFSREDFRSGGGSRWTGILPRGTEASLEIAEASAVQVRIGTVVVYPAVAGNARYFSTQGATPKWVGLYRTVETNQKVVAPDAQRVGAAVGMIVSGAANGTGGYTEWCCTGLMVSKDVMLTNWHCGKAATLAEWKSRVCPNTVVDMARDDRREVRQQYACDDVLAGDPDLDYALIRLRPVAGGSAYTGEPVYLPLTSAAPVSATDVFAVHHAQCKPKLLSRNCRSEPAGAANGARPTEFAHTCDTEPGASGAPIFDRSGRIMGLHHRGFQRNAACELAGPKKNYAVPVERIVKDLQMRRPGLASELGVAR